MKQTKAKKGISVVFQRKNSSGECGVLLYDKATGKCMRKYVIPEENHMGRMYYDVLEEVDIEKTSYLFFDGEDLIPDKDAHSYIVNGKYGKEKSTDDYKAVWVDHAYHWENTEKPHIPFDDCIMYCLHVRGFTKHKSSGVKERGTFRGIVEKIPYLKELGITTVELMPCYEFDEMGSTTLLNYWGYQEGYYYAPKYAYSGTGDPVNEFKDMVKALHQNGMEVIMQFHFPDKVFRSRIPDILRHWAYFYQVDGFRLIGGDIRVSELALNPYLADVKLIYSDFPVNDIYPENRPPEFKHLAVCEDSYMEIMRKYLKGDERLLRDMMYQMRRNPKHTGVIKYFSNYNSFTMADMVSYNDKHNEENGESNRDGTDYNFSWNCGVEGKTGRKEVLNLRKKQVKNAFLMLMTSQGTPMFFMGDEFGNSTKGNNNAYCQDNTVSWLNWTDLTKNQELHDFVKSLIHLRKENKVFHQDKECMLMDYKGCRYPDLSYHNENLWKPLIGKESRHLAFMFCGDYAPGCEGDYWYVAMNMHWESREFALPKLPKGKQWELYLATDQAEISGSSPSGKKKIEIAPRSIAICVNRKIIPE